MFICEECSRVSKSGQKCNITPVKTRKVVYPNGSIGVEIVKEKKLCDSCKG